MNGMGVICTGSNRLDDGPHERIQDIRALRDKMDDTAAL